MAKFSIIIPVYNVKQYLDTCIKSVLDQTFADFEVILIDDGSSDGSGELCDIWAAKDNRVTVIHQENQGLSGARNSGIKKASGEYLMFLDSDDWWDTPTVLAEISQRLDDTQAEVLSFDYQKSYKGQRNDPYFNKTNATDYTLKYMVDNELWVNGACNKAVSRRLFIENSLLFRSGISSEDMDWTLRLAIAAVKFDYLQTVVFVYRQRTASLSHSTTLKRVKDILDNIQICLNLLDNAKLKKNTLLPYVVYQYATLLYNYVGLKAREQKLILPAVKSLKWLLSESNNSKVSLIRKAEKMFGFKGMLLALRFRQLLSKRF